MCFQIFPDSAGLVPTGPSSIGNVVGSSGDNGAVTASLVTAFVILGEIIVSTIVIVILFYFGFMKVGSVVSGIM